MTRTLPTLGLLLLAGCSPPPETLGEPHHHSEGFTQLHGDYKLRKVDILIVLDNSSSMAEEQVTLANNLAGFIDVLESEDADSDYRIAITTTDAGHPSCPSSTPEHGAFMLTPCTSRLDEFVAKGEGGPSDVRAVACTDICDLNAAELAIVPTTTAEDPNPKPRPWLERAHGRSNLPEGVEMRDALSCFAPQGVAGCDFEAPLESMYQGLLRTQDVGDPAYGFLRKDAALLVVIVTDEDDCSVAPGAEEFFSADATSATCWNAGVTCVGDSSGYDSCEPVDNAVLHPLSRYVGLLEGIMAEKHELDPRLQPWIGIVAGAAADGSLHFADVGDSDPVFQQTFGIGPGCIGYPNYPDPNGAIRAIPPVRLFATLTALDWPAIYSICENDWTPVLEVLYPHSWPDQLFRLGCFPHCALDTNPATTTLEPDCIVDEELPDGSTHHIEECVRGDGGYLVDPETNDYQPPTEVDVCYVALTDAVPATPTPTDDMSPECTDIGTNLEFKIARRPGHPPVGGSRVTATCSLTDVPSIDCPNLDD